MLKIINILMLNNMEKIILIKIKDFMKENGKTTRKIDMEKKLIKMVYITKDNGRIIHGMEKVKRAINTDLFLLVNINRD